MGVDLGLSRVLRWVLGLPRHFKAVTLYKQQYTSTAHRWKSARGINTHINRLKISTRLLRGSGRFRWSQMECQQTSMVIFRQCSRCSRLSSIPGQHSKIHPDGVGCANATTCESREEDDCSTLEQGR